MSPAKRMAALQDRHRAAAKESGAAPVEETAPPQDDTTPLATLYPKHDTAAGATPPSPVQQARLLATQGFRVLPLRFKGHDPKTGKPEYEPTASYSEGETYGPEWFGDPTTEIAIVGGACPGLPESEWLLVVDVDTRHEAVDAWLASLPPTLTGHGGAHLYFRVPAGSVTCGPAFKRPGHDHDGIDLKAHNAYVRARWTWSEPPTLAAVAVLPAAALAALAAARGTHSAPTHAAGAAATSVAERGPEYLRQHHFDPDVVRQDAIAWLRSTAPRDVQGGQGGGACLVVAGALLVGFGLDDCTAIELMLDVWTPLAWPGEDPDEEGIQRKIDEIDRLGSSTFEPLHLAAMARITRQGKEAGLYDFSDVQVANDVATEAAVPIPAREEKRTDLGLGRRLARLHGADLRFFKARNLWYVWDGARWRADDTDEITRRAKDTVERLWQEAKEESDDAKRAAAFKWAAECQSRSRISNMIEFAKSEPGVPVTASELDSDPWLLNVRNGTLDLRSGQISAPDRNLLMTKVCATRFEAGARSALWEGVIADLFGDDHELRSYVQRAMGYALFGAWREKRFWFGYGPPDGGKSTFLGVIGDVLGDYHVTADATTWMLQSSNGGNRGDVTRLHGARLVTSLEVRASARFDQQLMKKVTGGDELTYAAKYESEISFRPTFGLWFGANDRPVIPDDDDGFWNRVACVPFTRVVPKERQDKALREKLASPEHAPAVLAWLVAGCIEWQRHGLGTCEAVTSATAAYKRDMNQVAPFLDECCDVGPDFSVPASVLRTAYDEWCRTNGVRHALNGKAFGARLRALGIHGQRQRDAPARPPHLVRYSVAAQFRLMWRALPERTELPVISKSL